VNPRRWRSLGLLALTQLIFTLDTTIVNPALPTIQREFSLSPGGLAWVVNGYTLMAGGFLIVGGRAADLLGRRRVFITGMLLFAVASAASGLAVNGRMLVCARFGQGLGEALAGPAALSLLVLLFPDLRERTKAIFIWGSISTLGSTLGLVISGIVISELSWRWIFLVNLPAVAVVLVLLPRWIGSAAAVRSGAIDITGALLITGGMTLLSDGLIESSEHAWTSLSVLLPVASAVGLLATFTLSQLRIRDPLVPLRFFRSRTRISGNVATVFAAASFLGVFFTMTLYLQDVLHYSALKTGLAWLPFVLTILGGLAASQWILERLGLRIGLGLSYTISAVCLFSLSAITTHPHYASRMLPALAVMGFTQGVNFPGLQNSALYRLDDRDAGLGSAIQSTAQQLGGSLGLALLVSVALRHTAALVAHGVAPTVAKTAGYSLTLKLSAGLTLLGAVAVVLLFEHGPLIRTDDHGAPAITEGR